MGDEHSIIAVPRDASSRRELLALRPPSWEYLLFGAELYAGLARTEPKWRDYHLGYSMEIGPRVPTSALPDEFSDRLSQAMAISGNIMKVISQRAQDAAFGIPGEPGDPALIEHMAGRLILLYEQLLDWAGELRSMRVDSRAEKLPELCAAFVGQPVAVTRSFVQNYIIQIESSLAVQAAGGQPEPIVMHIAFEISPAVRKAYLKELKRVCRR